MTTDIVSMFDQMASLGQAPADGCSLFGTGYEDAFQRLERKYLHEQFARGQSAEKFVVGPYGSGKTHFLNQLTEIARRLGCAAAVIQLSKGIDYTNGLLVYQELARELRVGEDGARGLADLMAAALDNVRRKGAAAGLQEGDVVDAWSQAIPGLHLESVEWARVLQLAIRAHLDNAPEKFAMASRWLSGEVTDRAVAKAVNESPVQAAATAAFSSRAKLSLFQFIRHAGYAGTVVGFDEAEQSMNVDRKKMAAILSKLLQEINSLVRVHDAAVLVVFAITPDVVDKILQGLPALAQRLSDPGPGLGFFDGNTLAPKIDLTLRGDPVDDLARIGAKLVDLFNRAKLGGEEGVSDLGESALRTMAEEVARLNPSSSARREMVKLVCAKLVTRRDGVAFTSPRQREREV